MLLSPGHSPRHLSSPSPSLSSDPPASSSSIVPATTTPISSKRKASVLDEDTYVAAIERIIERDYFPDIPKLRDRLDWLEAVRTGDPLQIRDAQLKIMERRQGKVSNLDTQGKFRTPGSTFFRESITPFELEKTPAGIDNSLDARVGEGDGVDVSFSLDQFFRRYTSEDNDSFTKLIDKVNRKRKERYGFLLEGEKDDDLVMSIEDVKRDRVTDGYGTSYQPTSTLEGNKFTAKNLLMYHPADRGEVPLTDEEMEERLKGLTKVISKPNTRFHGNVWSSSESKDDESVNVVYAPVAGATPFPLNLSDREMDKSRKYDLDDLRKTPNKFYVESEKVRNGYSFVKTPSPAPGADESPFITWGEIDGTPLRLDPEDTPFDIGGSANGPHFKIPSLPSRDVKAHSLSREAARNLKERSRMFQKPPLPSPVRSGSASPSARTLSSAAQKFVRNAIAKSSSSAAVDESLRASYRASSPLSNTPKSAMRSVSTRLGKSASPTLRSPSVREGPSPAW